MLKKYSPVLLVALLVSCGGDPAPKAPEKAPVDETEAPAPEAIPDPLPEISNSVYNAQSKETGADAQATYVLPKVGGDFPQLRAALSDKALLGEDIRSVTKNFESCACGTTGFQFKKTHVSSKAVSLTLTTEAMGAYPSTTVTFLTLDVKTGKSYPLSNEITPEGLKWMLKTYKKTLTQRIAKVKPGTVPGVDDESLAEITGALDENANGLTLKDLQSQYIFTSSGISVRTEALLPHAMAYVEPDRVVTFSTASLQKYLAPTATILKKH